MSNLRQRLAALEAAIGTVLTDDPPAIDLAAYRAESARYGAARDELSTRGWPQGRYVPGDRYDVSVWKWGWRALAADHARRLRELTPPAFLEAYRRRGAPCRWLEVEDAEWRMAANSLCLAHTPEGGYFDA